MKHFILSSKNKCKFYVIYKRQFFFKFNEEFPEFIKELPDFAGFGESINEHALQRAIDKGCHYIVFIHPKEVYIIPPLLIKKFCEAKKLFRVQHRVNLFNSQNYSGSYKKTHEKTYTFPKKLMKKFEEEIVIKWDTGE